jgi:hypothetical protein
VVRKDAEVLGRLSSAEIDALFEPAASYGAAGPMTREVLNDWAKARENVL